MLKQSCLDGTPLSRFTALLAAGASGLVLAIFVSCNARPANDPGGNPPGETGREPNSASGVTAVQGPGWLAHLGISGAMGRMGGAVPPLHSKREEPELVQEERGAAGPGGMGGMMRRIYPLIRSGSEKISRLMNDTFLLAGSDLYRLNCQSCHGPDGEGSPPEIKSLIGPVEGASAAFVRQRMERMGRPIDGEFVRELAAGADSALRERLKSGGEKMPAFRHLRGDEVDALVQYLKRLAHVPDAGTAVMLVPQSVARVGEHLVKGTCHVCHDATGPGPGQTTMMRGIIPSLAGMSAQQSMQDVVRQVLLGSSSMTSMMGGPTMPPFPYITEEEAAAAYLYLLEYPPRE